MSGLKDYNEDKMFSLKMTDLVDLSNDVLVSKLNNKCFDDDSIGLLFVRFYYICISLYIGLYYT